MEDEERAGREMVVGRDDNLDGLVVGRQIVLDDGNVYHRLGGSGGEGEGLGQSEAAWLLYAQTHGQFLALDTIGHAHSELDGLALVVLALVELQAEGKQLVVLDVEADSHVGGIAVGLGYRHAGSLVGVDVVIVGYRHIEGGCRLSGFYRHLGSHAHVVGQRGGHAVGLVGSAVTTALQLETHALAFLQPGGWGGQEEQLPDCCLASDGGVVEPVGGILARVAVGLDHHLGSHFTVDTHRL